MSNRSTRLLVLTLLCVVFGVLGCRAKKGASSAHERISVKIAMDLWPGYYPLILAEERGLLRDRGVDLEISFPQDTHGMLADFAGGRYQGICASLGDLILVSRRTPGAKFVLCTDESLGADQIIGSPAMRQPEQVRGRKIGTTLGGFGELLTRRYLATLGLTAQDVNIINADAADVPSLLDAGKLDLGHTWEPYATRARASGGVTLFTSAQTPGLVLDGLMLNRAFLADNPEAAQLIVTSWFEMIEWWAAHPRDAEQLIRNHLSRKNIVSHNPSLDGIRLCDRAANRTLFRAKGAESVHAVAEEYIEFFLSRGTLASRIQATEIIDPALIE